ncbi:MAG: ATP-binding cassette domain-containing protein [Methylococcaceae bacterium]|nr:ATP-binding cassette domain-containing protein [Methylococcaceae bacterium]
MTNNITITNLRFRYPDMQTPCLDIPAFHVDAGDRIFIYGPSGSGKSTLLGLLGGVLSAESGSIHILGNDFTKMSQTQRDRLRADHIGFIFQQFNLIPYLSVIDNVLLPCRFSNLRLSKALTNSNNLTTEAERLLSQLDLNPSLWRKPVTQLSVGQQQRVAAARALIGKPEIIIADEPTSALDADRQAAFLALLLRECTDANAMLLFVSHDRRLASAFNREIDLTSINHAVMADFLLETA